ncbi:2OG-Fe(II) oxygenase [Tenacibaculum ovolyticum]|uniref:2OG-Fe(II) oxygenase n=1 Tax=Tenacibaculum ovolyticum TaxID=104270 RepID=UPI000421481D|nr:2OG-Fe(II) oxygenase [Tenacibaculum ovolyticum]
MGKNDIQEENQFEKLIQGLINEKHGSCNDFLSPITMAALRENMVILNDSGKMIAAGIGNKLNFHKNDSIRKDKVNWISEQSINKHEKVYLNKIWRFIDYLNKTCFTSIRNFESHYSSYEKGSFYRKHIDQFKSEKGREYSIVLYLNQNWKDEDDGQLSLYPLNREQINISPLEGRLVFFRSDEMEHEVHSSSTRERRSIAGWLKK